MSAILRMLDGGNIKLPNFEHYFKTAVKLLVKSENMQKKTVLSEKILISY